MREMPKYHHIKVAPYQFVEPNFTFLPGQEGQLADADGAKTKVNANAAGGGKKGEIAEFGIPLQE